MIRWRRCKTVRPAELNLPPVPASDIHDADPGLSCLWQNAAEADAMIESLYVAALKAEADFDTRLLDLMKLLLRLQLPMRKRAGQR